MKKILLVVLSVMLLVGRVYAVSAEDSKVDLDDYKTLNFKEILKEEEIKEEFKSYSENDKQVTIYLFRGLGCGYCRSFLTFLNSITDEYGSKFKVVGFEVWGDQDNSKLLDSVSTFIGSAAGGVPYIIIGDHVFPGYANSYDADIKAAIDEQYEAEEKYDVFEEYNKAVDKAKKAAQGNTGVIVLCTFLFVAIATVIILVDNKKKYNELLARIDNKTTKVVEEKKKEVVKKEVKKVSNAKKKKK